MQKKEFFCSVSGGTYIYNDAIAAIMIDCELILGTDVISEKRFMNLILA